MIKTHFIKNCQDVMGGIREKRWLLNYGTNLYVADQSNHRIRKIE